jgi:hypothetical protein
MAQALIALGIQDPIHSGARESLYTFTCAANLTDETKSRRIALVKDLQKKFLGKTVHRIREKNKAGKVEFICLSPRSYFMYSQTSIPEISAFHARVAFWNGQKMHVPLDVLELVE